jgi:hypothetical protein
MLGGLPAVLLQQPHSLLAALLLLLQLLLQLLQHIWRLGSRTLLLPKSCNVCCMLLPQCQYL